MFDQRYGLTRKMLPHFSRKAFLHVTELEKKETFSRKKRNIDEMQHFFEANEDLLYLQKAELSILDKVIQICNENKIRYFLAAGTLLGAVRHNGFIPWDDDIDISMPRSDYNRFISCAIEQLPNDIRVVNFHLQENGERLIYHTQIQDTKVKIRQDIAIKPIITYAWIDIFPIDGMPKNLLKRKLHGVYLLYRRAKMQLSMFEENVNIYKKNRPYYEKLIIWIYLHIHVKNKLNPFQMMEKLDHSLQKYSDSCDIWITFMGAYKLREMFPSAFYGEGKLYEFEERLLTGPYNAEAVLRKLYGNYMIPAYPTGKQENLHNITLIGEQ